MSASDSIDFSKTDELPVEPHHLGRAIAVSSHLAESPDERSVPNYLQSIALSLVDIAESLRIIEQRNRDERNSQ